MHLNGTYVIRIDDELVTYNDLNDIPGEFDNLIRFNPEIPEGPHTDEEHKMLESLNDILHDLLKRERR